MVSRKSGEAYVRILPDTKRFNQELKRKLAAVDAKIKVDAVPDTTKFGQQLRAELKKVKESVDVKVTADTKKLTADVKTALKRIESDKSSVNIKADVNGKAAEAQLARIARDRTATIHVNVDGAGLSAISGIIDAMDTIGERADYAGSQIADFAAIAEYSFTTARNHADEAADSFDTMGDSADNAYSRASTSARKATSDIEGTTRSIDRSRESANRSSEAYGRMGRSAGSARGRIMLLGGAVSALGVGLSGLLPVTFSASAAIGQFAISTGAALGSVAIPAVTGLGLAFFALKGATAGVLDALSGDAEDAAEALAELPPAARDSVRAMRELKGEFTEFNDNLKNNFFGAFKNVGELSNLVIPVKNAMSEIASETGRATDTLVRYITQGTGLRATEKLLHSSGVATGNLVNALSGVVGGLVAIGGAASPILEKMVAGVEASTRAWAQNMLIGYQTGQLQQKLAGHFDNMRQGWQTFTSAMKTTGSIIGGVWDAVKGSGDEAYNSIANIFNRMDAWVNSSAGQASLAAYFSDAQSVAAGLLNLVGQLGSAIGGNLAPAMAQAMKAAGPGVTDFINGLSDGLKAITPAIPIAAQAIGNLFSAISPLAPLVGSLASAFGQTLAPAVSGIATVFGLLTPAIQGVTTLVQAMPAPIAGMVAAWLALKAVPALFPKIGSGLGTVHSALVKTNDAIAGTGGKFSAFRESVSDTQKAMAASGAEVGKFSATMAHLGTSSNQTLAAMGQAYTNASAKAMQFATAHSTAAREAAASAIQTKSAFQAMDFMGQQLGHTMVASSARVVGAARGMVAGGFSLIKSGASGVIGALGGPWTVAIMAAVSAITFFSESARKAKEVQQQLAAKSREVASAQRELQKAVAGTTGELNENGLAAAAKLATAELSDFIATGEQFSGVSGKISLGFSQMGDAAYAKSMVAASEGYDALKSSLESLGFKMEDVGKIVATGGADFDILQKKLRESGDGGVEAANKLQQARDSIDRVAAAARTLPADFAQVNAAIETLSNKASSASEKADALRVVLDRLNGNTPTVTEAMFRAQEAVEQLGQKLEQTSFPADQLGKALFNAKGQLDETNPAARALYDSMGSLQTSFLEMSGAGVPVQEAFSKIEPSLKALQKEFGLTDQEVDALRQQFNLMPDQVNMAMKLDGADTVHKELFEVFSQLSTAEKGATIPVKALSKEAIEALESLGYKVNDLSETDGIVKISANKDGAEAALAHVLGLMDLTSQPKTVSINTGEDFAATQAALEALQIKVGEPKNGTVDITFPGGFGLFEQLDQLGYKVSEPKNGVVNIQDNTGNVMALLESLRIKATEPKPGYVSIDSNDPQVRARLIELGIVAASPKGGHVEITDNANNVRSNILGIPKSSSGKHDVKDNTKKVKDEVNTLNKANTEAKHTQKTNVPQVREDIRSLNNVNTSSKHTVHVTRVGDRMATGGVWNGYANGGLPQLPAYAHGDRHNGYQLPTTGPGTNVTDGFLAYTGAGAPAAWLDAGEWVINRNSSKRYHRELAEINSGTFPKLPGYADGYNPTGSASGTTGQTLADRWATEDGNQRVTAITVDMLLRWLRGETINGVRPPGGTSLHGAPYIFGGGSNNDWGDCSATASMAAGMAVGAFDGGKPLGRLFTTATEEGALAGLGFTPGLKFGDNILTIGWYNGGAGGGHTSSSVGGTNFEMGGSGSSGKIGNNADSPASSKFTHHAWIELADPNSARGVLDGYNSDYDSTNSSSSYSGTSTTSYSGTSATSSDEPTTWSGAAGKVAETAVSGHVKDILGVFGISDELPPVVRAAQQAKQKQQEEKKKNGTTATEDGYTTYDANGKKKTVKAPTEQELADQDAKVQFAEQELELAKLKRDETYNKTDKKGNKTATESQKQSADLRVQKAEEKLAKEKRKKEELQTRKNTVDGYNNRDTATNNYNPNGGVEQWHSTVVEALQRMGLPVSLAGITKEQIGIESGGDPNAQNNSDSNAAKGDPSKGLLQVILSTFRAMRKMFPEANAGLPEDQTHPLANIVAALGWTVHKYGGPDKIWPTRNGYATGGHVHGAGGGRDDKIPAMLSHGEFVVNARDTAKNLGALKLMNAGVPMARLAGMGDPLENGASTRMSPPVANMVRQHFAVGGLAVAGGAGGVQAAMLAKQAKDQLEKYGLMAVDSSKQIMAGLIGGKAVPTGENLTEEAMNRVNAAFTTSVGHMGTFANQVGTGVFQDFKDSLATRGADARDFVLDQAAQLTAQAGQLNQTLTTVTRQPANNSSSYTNAPVFNINTADTRDGLRQSQLHSWRMDALSHSGGRR